MMAFAIMGGLLLMAAILHQFEEWRWSKVGVTAEERKKLKEYVVRTTKRSKEIKVSDYEHQGGADFYLFKLRDLFNKLKDPHVGRITRASRASRELESCGHDVLDARRGETERSRY